MSINAGSKISRKEQWRWIPGYEGLYMVSDKGRVMGLPKQTHYGHIMSLKTTRYGYITVCLCKNNKKYHPAVHRLVASAFLKNNDNKPVVNHLDGKKDDNRVENLEWSTNSENELHSYRVLGKKPITYWKNKPRMLARKFTDDQVRAIRSDERSLRQIAKDYGVSKTAIRDVKIGRNYREVDQCL